VIDAHTLLEKNYAEYKDAISFLHDNYKTNKKNFKESFGVRAKNREDKRLNERKGSFL